MRDGEFLINEIHEWINKEKAARPFFSVEYLSVNGRLLSSPAALIHTLLVSSRLIITYPTPDVPADRFLLWKRLFLEKMRIHTLLFSWIWVAPPKKGTFKSERRLVEFRRDERPLVWGWVTFYLVSTSQSFRFSLEWGCELRIDALCLKKIMVQPQQRKERKRDPFHCVNYPVAGGSSVCSDGFAGETRRTSR